MSTPCTLPGAVLIEREHLVPLVHGEPRRGQISVFTREVKEFRDNDQTLLIPALGFNIGGPICASVCTVLRRP